jgi:hypothetical protein
MSYPKEGRNHLFLYHGYALALGGWVRDQHGQITSLPSLAPSVLSLTGGYGAASDKNVNFAVPGSYQFGENRPRGFHLYVGHAYSEVRGTVEDDQKPYGQYVTRVRSILDNVRFNDDLYIEHAEAVLESRHDNPGNDAPVAEAEVKVGDSDMFGVFVRGEKVQFTKRRDADHIPRYGEMRQQVDPYLQRKHEALVNGRPEPEDEDPFLSDLCDWHEPIGLEGAPRYVIDTATQNQKAQNHFRYSLFKDVQVPKAPGIKSSHKSSVDVEDFGRIFLGEVIASHGTKQVNMFRLDLGCDNCGGVGGSSGSTNGSTYPP